MDASLTAWLNAAVVLVGTGAATYFSLWRYME